MSATSWYAKLQWLHSRLGKSEAVLHPWMCEGNLRAIVAAAMMARLGRFLSHPLSYINMMGLLLISINRNVNLQERYQQRTVTWAKAVISASSEVPRRYTGKRAVRRSGLPST